LSRFIGRRSIPPIHKTPSQNINYFTFSEILKARAGNRAKVSILDITPPKEPK